LQRAPPALVIAGKNLRASLMLPGGWSSVKITVTVARGPGGRFLPGNVAGFKKQRSGNPYDRAGLLDGSGGYFRRPPKKCRRTK
jgi:hypothetical protein